MGLADWVRRAVSGADSVLAAVFPTSAKMLELAELRKQLTELGVDDYEPVEAAEADEEGEGEGRAVFEPFEPFESFGGAAEPAVFPLINTNGVPMNGVVDMNGSLYGCGSDSWH